MPRIAFCDDDAALLHQMQDFLEQYRTLRGVQLELFPYTKPMELLADIEAGVRFDVLFLDVLMPGINGINAAREIRRYDTAVQIIFVTSSSEFAVQSYLLLQTAPPRPGYSSRCRRASRRRCREAGQGAFIETIGHEKGKKLFLQITNSCLPDVQFREGIPVTDRPGHGLGVRSICAISERYSGLTSFAAKDGQFTLRIML